ncbi:beta-1,4 N-acetylgalactosaminyltransferase 1-like [Saccoglossus kowalevskii]|uniref:Beta-1,4 N-acetylgalactosaminyltransferase 1-like n=1 Tax=Saccoglossus kowalevskii TaxID=10224 RepID=A0ABM0GWF9_SACKO|nr:PREDICTED: beta-1,4 N-acetylgalactosaminyltransferase 1-like [Saccoglossus kowalevskii]
MGASLKTAFHKMYNVKLIIACIALLCVISAAVFMFHAPQNTSYRIANNAVSERLLAVEKFVSPQPTPCTCGHKSYGPLEDGPNIRRQKEVLEWKRYHNAEIEPLSVCRAMSPFQYVGGGITLEPLGTVRVIGLSIHPSAVAHLESKHDFVMKLSSDRLIGVIHVHTADFDTVGNYTTSLIIRGKADITSIDDALHSIYYTSIVYDIDDRDTINLQLNGMNVSINIRIKRQTVPFLIDPGSGDITKKVTVVVKTFERYDAVKRLVKSVHQFYPNMTIIVADDSENPQKIVGSNVKHYIMPHAEGASAGRNLQLSQVRTKYFLYCDDDFVFTIGTKLEIFLEKFENPKVKLDVIGGTFGDEKGEPKESCFGCRTISWVKGDKDGDCFIRHTTEKYDQLSEYPNCYMADSITMFFMARTEAFRRGVFDPEYERVGHTEYFINRLGRIRLASCDDVNIMHVRESNPTYAKYRKRLVDRNDQRKNVQHMLFNMNLKCFTL